MSGKPLKTKRKIRLGDTPISRIEDRYIVNSESECHEWTGPRNNAGYGQLSFNNTKYLAHRFSYILAFGEIPIGFHICHICDNPCCINPTHLFVGTDKTNAEDKVAKGRHPKFNATYCKNGHLRSENIYISKKGHHRCRSCTRLDNQKRENKNRFIGR